MISSYVEIGVLSMKINPGGKLNLEDIVGRGPLVARILSTLEAQSVLLVAERRMGKTHVLQLLQDQPPAGWTVLKRDVEGIRSATEFVQYAMADLHPLLGKVTRFREWLSGIGTEIGGAQIGPVKLPNFAARGWKQVLVDTLSHLADTAPGTRVVFLWDELPMMLQNLGRTAPQEATELLDVLRSIRQENPRVRMVFTGSIGLHHVVRQLKLQGYANAPVNDMAVVEVPPLDPNDATALALRLFRDNHIALADNAVAATIAREVDGIPFYIHHVLRTLSQQVQPITEKAACAAVSGAMRSAQDPWHLQHYEDRTQEYYGADRAACHALLDAVAAADGPLAVQAAINGAKASHPDLDRERWLVLIRLLERDFYLVRDADGGALRYKFGIVERWWRIRRDLGPATAKESP